MDLNNSLQNGLSSNTMPSGDDSKVIAFGLGVLIVVFVIFGGWMAFAPLSSASVAVGKVSADSEKKSVQHFQGGTISKILIKEGDLVKKDQTLIILDVLQAKAELESYKRQYMDSMASFARLVAQRDDSNSIDFPLEITDINIIEDHKNIFYTTTKSLKDQKEISQQRVVQLQNQISGLKSLIDVRKNRIISLKEELKEWEVLYAQQLVDKIKIRDINREINSLEGEIASSNAEIAKLGEQINEIKTQQLLTEKEFRNQVLDQIVQVQNIISDLKSKISSLEDVFQKSEIKAPISGNVVGLSTTSEGAVIRPGDDILQIIPENSDLIVTAQVSITDIDKVQVGLLSDIRFSAFNLQQAHVIEGEVIHISADRFTDEATGEPYYEAKIKVTKKGEERLKEYGFKLLPGMPAEVMINIGSRTPLSYLVKPFTDMISRGFNEE